MAWPCSVFLGNSRRPARKVQVMVMFVELWKLEAVRELRRCQAQLGRTWPLCGHPPATNPCAPAGLALGPAVEAFFSFRVSIDFSDLTITTPPFWTPVSPTPRLAPQFLSPFPIRNRRFLRSVARPLSAEGFGSPLSLRPSSDTFELNSDLRPRHQPRLSPSCLAAAPPSTLPASATELAHATSRTNSSGTSTKSSTTAMTSTVSFSFESGPRSSAYPPPSSPLVPPPRRRPPPPSLRPHPYPPRESSPSPSSSPPLVRTPRVSVDALDALPPIAPSFLLPIPSIERSVMTRHLGRVACQPWHIMVGRH